MTCREAIDTLADYLDATLGAELGRELELHLSGCAPCQAYLNTYRRTTELGREAGRIEMPPEMKRHLREFLAKRLGRDPA
jgi:anti-sigma factor RsiW